MTFGRYLVSACVVVFILALAHQLTDRIAMFAPPTEPKVIRLSAWQYRLYGWWAMPIRDAWFRYVIGPPKHW